MKEFDIVIIGSGPGGYRAAVRFRPGPYFYEKNN